MRDELGNWKPDPFRIDQLDLIEGLAGIGCTIVDMARLLGVSRATFYNRLRDYPEVQERIEIGKTKAKAQLLRSIHDLALSGDYRALTWLLSVWHGIGNAQRPADQVYASMTTEELCREREMLQGRNQVAQERIAKRLGTGDAESKKSGSP